MIFRARKFSSCPSSIPRITKLYVASFRILFGLSTACDKETPRFTSFTTNGMTSLSRTSFGFLDLMLAIGSANSPNPVSVISPFAGSS